MKSYRSRLFREGLAASRVRREVFLSFWADGCQGRGADMMDISGTRLFCFIVKTQPAIRYHLTHPISNQYSDELVSGGCSVGTTSKTWKPGQLL